MKGKDIFDSIGHADDRYIEEASGIGALQPIVKKRFSRLRTAALVSCFILLLFGMTIGGVYLRNSGRIPSPETAPGGFTESITEPTVTSPVTTPETGAVTTGPYEKEYNYTGYYMRTENGADILLTDIQPIMPIVLTAGSGTEYDGITGFDGLTNGDYIGIYAERVEELYPARAQISYLTLIENGDISNLDGDVVASLAEMGYALTCEPDTNTSYDGIFIATDDGSGFIEIGGSLFTIVLKNDTINDNGLASGDRIRISSQDSEGEGAEPRAVYVYRIEKLSDGLPDDVSDGTLMTLSRLGLTVAAKDTSLEGTFVGTADGSGFFIEDNNAYSVSYIIRSNDSVTFDGITTGDRIRIDAARSEDSQAIFSDICVYGITKTAQGSVSDVAPASLLWIQSKGYIISGFDMEPSDIFLSSDGGFRFVSLEGYKVIGSGCSPYSVYSDGYSEKNGTKIKISVNVGKTSYPSVSAAEGEGISVHDALIGDYQYYMQLPSEGKAPAMQYFLKTDLGVFSVRAEITSEEYATNGFKSLYFIEEALLAELKNVGYTAE